LNFSFCDFTHEEMYLLEANLTTRHSSIKKPAIFRRLFFEESAVSIFSFHPVILQSASFASALHP
jgi:hypothetical protein